GLISRHHQQRPPNHFHRRPRSPERPEPHMDGLLSRPLGRRHARRRHRRFQRPGLARHRRSPAHRSPPHHRTLPPPRFRPHGSATRPQRSQSLHPPVHRENR